MSTTSDDLATLLYAVDVVVVVGSTVGLQAAIAGRPVVQVQCSTVVPTAPFVPMGFARPAANEHDLESALCEVVEGHWRPSSLLPRAGESTAAVISVINELLATS